MAEDVAALDPQGGMVEVGNVKLYTQGLEGEARSYRPGADGTRSLSMAAAEATRPALDGALDNARLIAQETIEIANPHEVAPGASASRSTATGEPAMIVEVPAPNEEWGQLILYTDEAGVTTWNFARDNENRIVSRGGGSRTYLIRRFVAPSGSLEVAQTRSLSAGTGKKLLKVLAFKLADPVLGEVGDYFARRWEAHYRPYRLRTFLPEDYASPDPQATLSPGDHAAWNKLAGDPAHPALLMVHGTFSRAHTAFGALPDSFVKELHRIYGGRVFAFDHFTMSHDPRQNVEQLIEQLPPSIRLNLDIICHSRGGLVSRVLAERLGDLSVGARQIAINKLIFVAAPNAGTLLTDSSHMGDLIDSYTNLLNFLSLLLPANAVTEILDAVITVAKHLAVATLKGLEGLQSMLPTGDFLEHWLNQGRRRDRPYYAIAASFLPTEPGFKAWFENRLLGQVFNHADNDCVVPTAGVYERNGSDCFPIEDRLCLGTEKGVSHGTYFANAEARDRILRWLAAP